MDTPARVLIIGRDESRLEAIAVVFRHFWVVEKTQPEQMQEPAAHSDLAVLSDCIPELERQRLIEQLRAEWPALMSVKVNGYDAGPHASADATVDAIHGPGALVSTIYGLLTERGIPSRSWASNDGREWIQ